MWESLAFAGLPRLAALLLPSRCAACLVPGPWLCERCRASVRLLEEPLCRRCGGELESAGSSCGCRGRMPNLSRLRSAADYSGPVEALVHRLKYRGWSALAEPAAEMMLERIALDGAWSEVVLAVPLHPRRRRSRGYNQSELIARRVRRRLRLPAPPGRLVRTRDTPSQVGLDRPRRRENVRGAFAWRGPAGAGRPVLLIDDVATTGATLDACAAALRAAGFGRVMGLTLGRVAL